MPGVFQMSIDEILKECEYLCSIDLKSIILFAIPDVKDSVGSECLCDESIIARTIKAIKAKFPDMFVVTDLCFCEYTDHGHCGILDPKTQTVDNDKTLEISAQQA
jgi:porphobilinogen synthase